MPKEQVFPRDIHRVEERRFAPNRGQDALAPEAAPETGVSPRSEGVPPSVGSGDGELDTSQDAVVGAVVARLGWMDAADGAGD